MCGRYFYDLDSEELKELYKKIQEQARREEKLAEEIANGDVYPSNQVVTIAKENDEIRPILTRWGFEGFKKGQLLINARSETVEHKKTFAKPFQEHRCVFPMTGFYEWNADKQKYLFSAEDTLYVAGFYRVHHSLEGSKKESIIMTTKPNDTVAKIHDRMPLLVDKKDINQWLSNIEFARQLIDTTMPELQLELIS